MSEKAPYIKRRGDTPGRVRYDMWTNEKNKRYVGGYEYPEGSNTNRGSSGHFAKGSGIVGRDLCAICNDIKKDVVNSICLPCTVGG